MKNRILWHLCIIGFVLLCALAFTTLVIPYGVVDPFMLGLPRTLWVGILLSVSIFTVTVIAAWASQPENKGGSE